jgi:valyl-tRNA synthetase
VDLAAEQQRLEKEISIMQREIGKLEQRLQDTAFTAKAPAQIVDKEKERLQSYRDKLSRLTSEMEQLS